MNLCKELIKFWVFSLTILDMAVWTIRKFKFQDISFISIISIEVWFIKSIWTIAIRDMTLYME